LLKEKDLILAELKQLNIKFEEVQRDYLKAIKDATYVPPQSLDRHEELRDLLSKITQEKDQMQRSLLKATD